MLSKISDTEVRIVYDNSSTVEIFNTEDGTPPNHHLQTQINLCFILCVPQPQPQPQVRPMFTARSLDFQMTAR